MFIAYLLPKLNLTEELNDRIISFLDKFSPAEEMHKCLKTSISDNDYLAIQLRGYLTLDEDPDVKDLNYLFLKQHYHLNGSKEIPIIYYITKIAKGFMGTMM